LPIQVSFATTAPHFAASHCRSLAAIDYGAAGVIFFFRLAYFLLLRFIMLRRDTLSGLFITFAFHAASPLMPDTPRRFGFQPPHQRHAAISRHDTPSIHAAAATSDYCWLILYCG